MNDIVLYVSVIGFGGIFLLGWLLPSPLQWAARRKLHAENRALREHLFTKMETDAAGLSQLKQEHERLKQMNEHLRITNHTLRHKPGRAEPRLLHIYDEAINIMCAKAPGFAPVWHGVVADVERGMQETEQGMRAFVKKVFRPSAQLERLATAKSRLRNWQNTQES